MKKRGAMPDTTAPESKSVTVEGVELFLPLEVQASTSIVASFRVDPQISQEVIGESGLNVRIGDDGLTSLFVVDMSYLQSDFGRYNEVGIIFDVESLGEEDSANFIQRLPVTGEFSCAVGKQVWGFPKWVTDLRYIIYGEASQVEWFEDNEVVLRLRLGAGGEDIGDADMPVSSYSIGPEGPQCTQTEMRNFGIVIGAPVDLEIGSSNHPAAQALRDLKVAELEPVLTTRVNHSSSSWGLPQPRSS
jgi:hypothetical protein